MNEVIKFLNDNPVQYFSTVGLDGRPKVRPFQFILEKDGKLYFCTNNQKDVYNEIKNNPYVEICTSSSTFSWIRLSGKVVFTDNLDIKKIIIEHSLLVKSLYNNAENPIFEAFYLKDIKATISDFSGNPPVTYVL